MDVGNDYFTLYGNLENISKDLTLNTFIPRATFLGEMDYSPEKGLRYLHFSVFRDNGNGIWDGVDIDKAVDPFGWQRSSGEDPWVSDMGGPESYYLWLERDASIKTFNASRGTQMETPFGNFKVIIPPNAAQGFLTVELSESLLDNYTGQTIALSKGYSLNVESNYSFATEMKLKDHYSLSVDNDFVFNKPLSITLSFAENNNYHLNLSDLAIYRWNSNLQEWEKLESEIDFDNFVVSTVTSKAGTFSLRAPLVCPFDINEPDDNYYLAKQIEVNSDPIINIFDVFSDEDWFKVGLKAGKSYLFETKNLGSGVKAKMSVYDLDAQTLLVTNDENNSLIHLKVNREGIYYIRLSRQLDSSYGCNSDYSFSIKEIEAPLIKSINGPSKVLLFQLKK